jgi:hypothetical protein
MPTAGVSARPLVFVTIGCACPMTMPLPAAGRNAHGELGEDTTTTRRLVPTAVILPSGIEWSLLSAGWRLTCGLGNIVTCATNADCIGMRVCESDTCCTPSDALNACGGVCTTKCDNGGTCTKDVDCITEECVQGQCNICSCDSADKPGLPTILDVFRPSSSPREIVIEFSVGADGGTAPNNCPVKATKFFLGFVSCLVQYGSEAPFCFVDDWAVITEASPGVFSAKFTTSGSGADGRLMIRSASLTCASDTLPHSADHIIQLNGQGVIIGGACPSSPADCNLDDSGWECYKQTCLCRECRSDLPAFKSRMHGVLLVAVLAYERSD